MQKSTLFYKNTLVVAVALGLSVAMTACSNQSSTDSHDVKTKDDAVAQSITINNASEPETLDPHLASGVQEANIIRQYLEGLVSSDNDGNLIPGMATEWSSPDNKVWTFKLRDAKWSNGDPVTAHDFVYSFRRLVDTNTASPYASYLEDAKIQNATDVINGRLPTDKLGVMAIDDKTLQIVLTEPIPYFPDMLTHTSVQPVHQKTIEALATNGQILIILLLMDLLNLLYGILVKKSYLNAIKAIMTMPILSWIY